MKFKRLHKSISGGYMKKFDYLCARCVGKFLNGTEWLMKTTVPTKSKGLKKQLNISYGEHKNQRMDFFYLPQVSDEKRPIFFYIHGGGFVSGLTSMRRPFCAQMAKQGYFVVNIDYRPAPLIHFPEHFNDIFKAVDFVLERGEEYNLDISRIVIGGESAGAYFSSYIAAMTKDKSLYLQNNIDFRWKNEFNLSAVVLINGAYKSADIIKVKSAFSKTFIKAFFDFNRAGLRDSNILNENKLHCPLNFIDSNFPPTVVIRGKYDIFDLGSKSIIEVFEKQNVKHSVFLAKGMAGLHAGTIAMNFKYSKKALQFITEKLNGFIKSDI